LPLGRVKQGISLTQPPRFITGPDYYRAPWTSIKSIVIDPSNPQNMYAADYNSGVYASPDGGATWSAINDSLTMRTVTGLAIAADGGMLYAATFGGGVFRLPLGANYAPRIAFASPPTGSVLLLDQAESVQLCVTAYDLDGDELDYGWFLDGLEWPGTDECFTVNGIDLSPGDHTFTVEVSDADTNVFVDWELDILLDVTEDNPPEGLPREYALAQNYPNPFNPSTAIEYALPVRSDVTLVIHNILGQTVETIVDKVQPAGSYRILWDGTDARGKQVASGVYFYHLKAGTYSASRRMLLLK
jgi:hypothetical protein